jgi:hypothetical protein
MEESLPAPPARTGEDAATHPYGPSWIDGLTTWVSRLSGPAWLFYLLLGSVLFLLISVIKWSDGTYAWGELSPFYAAQAFIIPYMLAVVHLLDDRAAQALETFRPGLAASEQQYQALRHRLTTLPAGPALGATALGVVYWLLPFNNWTPDETRLFKLGSSPLAAALEQILSIGAWGVVGLFVYHSAHQLGVVNRIYTKYTRIDLFKLGPLYAFSTVSAITALAIIGGHFFYMLPALVVTPLSSSSIVNSVLFGVVGAAAFFGPLLGAHQQLVKEKQKWLDDNAGLLRATILEVHQRAQATERQAMDQLKLTLDNLVIEQEQLRKLPTWPWRSETLQAVGTALLLPLLLSLLEELLRHILGYA